MQHISECLLLWITIVSIVECSRIESSSTPNDASVAVLDCNQKHPNVYFDVLRKEWMVHGADTKCYQNEKGLLDLCRAVYPGLSVTNIMRMDEPIRFTVYVCSTNENSDGQVVSLERNKRCSKLLIKNVTPYKCLYGEYKSENLHIPPTCEFQHLISDSCQTQDHLNLLATQKCKSSNSALNSSMLLKWCDNVGTFTGIEFVCCPNTFKNYFPATVIEDENIDDELSYDYNYDDYEEYDDYNSINHIGSNSKKLIGAEEKTINNDLEPEFNDITPNDKKQLKKLNNMKSTMNKLDANEFIENFNKVQKIVESFDVVKEEQSDLEAVEGTFEQKQQYEKQKNFIIKSIQNSTENLIKEKQKTSSYLTENKDEKDSIFYEPILRNLNDQYQVRFDRLNKEKERLLLQEEISYEQQVQGRLNENKLNTIKELNRVMQQQENKNIAEINLQPLVSTLNNFLIAQENDRLHMVAVYKKLKAYFPEQIHERSQSIINHLDSIDKTIDETKAVFTAKFKLLSKCIFPLLREHLKRYVNVKDESRTIRNELKNLQTNYIVTDLRTTESPLVKLGSSNDQKFDNSNLNSKNTKFDYYEVDDDDLFYYDDEEELNDDKDEYDEEFYDDDFESDDIKNDAENHIDIKRIGQASSLSAFLFMAAISLGIFLSLICMYSMIKRKRLRSQTTVKNGFLPVDTVNPEDRHVNMMQTNGYENPTYKYFENSVQA